MEAAQFYLNILNELQDGIYYVDRNRRITFWNAAAEKITGYTSQEIVGKSCPDSGLNHISCDGLPLCSMGCPLYQTLADGKQRREQVFVRHKKGYRIPIQINAFPIRENGLIVGAAEVFTQNSPTVFEDNLIDHLTFIAIYDKLTELPNRRYTESFLEHKLEDYRNFGRQFAVLYADIDDFSRINNVYGHDGGDAVLQNIAKSLKRSVRRNDLIGRWGGEEFLGIYAISSPKECRDIGERFRVLIENTEIQERDCRIHTTISIGITMIREEDTFESVINRADGLMYQSKHTGKNCVSTDISAGTAVSVTSV